MIHRFVDLVSEIRLPDIPILALDQSPLSTRTIWQIGNRATPYRMTQPFVDALTATHLGDPQREPVTGDSVVYSRFTVSGTISRSVRLVDWADTTDVELYSETGGSGASLEPTWKPDGTKILFRAKGAGTALNVLKTMNPDGTGVTTIYTGGAEVQQAAYSSDGTKIAWSEGQKTIMVANADGTSPTAVFTATGITIVGGVAWQKAANVLAFRHDGGTFSSNELWKVINADGTGLATWLTISRASGYGPGDGDPDAIMYSWTSGNKIATTVRQIADPDPDSRLTLVDSGGSNLITPARYGGSNAGSVDQRPAVLTGQLEGVERIFWLAGLGAPVVSVLPDGSDYRVDFAGTESLGGSAFHGFRGDTVNV